jgi:hypothetical protein
MFSQMMTKRICDVHAMQRLDYLSLAGYNSEITAVSQQAAKRLVRCGDHLHEVIVRVEIDLSPSSHFYKASLCKMLDWKDNSLQFMTSF